MCKIPAGGISKVTEQCFKDGHLKFAGKKQWIQDMKGMGFDPTYWISQNAVRTTSGTNPEGIVPIC